MSHTADAAVEPKVETTDEGSTMADSETKLATEAVHGNKASVGEGGQVDKGHDVAGAATVCHFPTYHRSSDMRCGSFY